MKTHENILKPVRRYFLIGIIVLITLFGLTLKARAQSTSMGHDVDKISNAMVVKLSGHDFDVIVPKIRREEMIAMEDVTFNQLVYVAGEEAGFYFYTGSHWGKQKVGEVFELIDVNLSLQEPVGESLIILADKSTRRVLLDYNHHVKQIYQDFMFDTSDHKMAINIRKK